MAVSYTLQLTRYINPIPAWGLGGGHKAHPLQFLLSSQKTASLMYVRLFYFYHTCNMYEQHFQKFLALLFEF